MKSLHISIPLQQLTLLDNKMIIKIYPISSSKYGLGTEEGSYKTPLGNFIIAEKIGGDQPIYTIFKGRVPVGIWNPENIGSDPITSRILWLSGADEDNKNTYERYVYIHGTTEENLIGTPASHGCIRMKNQDIVELFDLVDRGTQLVIENK